MIKEPQPQFKQPLHTYPDVHPSERNVDYCWRDTNVDLPAMPKDSSFSGTLGWHDSLPKIRKVDQPPYWSVPQKLQELDFEKLTGRAFLCAMALTTLIFAIIFLVKLLQFATSVTLK